MLDHAHLGCALLQHRAQPGFPHQVIAGRNLHPQVGAAEDNAAARRRGQQPHMDGNPGMQGGALDRDRLGNGMAHDRLIAGRGAPR